MTGFHSQDIRVSCCHQSPKFLTFIFSVWLTSEHVTNFGSVPFGDLRVTTLAVKKLRVRQKPELSQLFMGHKFGGM